MKPIPITKVSKRLKTTRHVAAAALDFYGVRPVATSGTVRPRKFYDPRDLRGVDIKFYQQAARRNNAVAVSYAQKKRWARARKKASVTPLRIVPQPAPQSTLEERVARIESLLTTLLMKVAA